MRILLFLILFYSVSSYPGGVCSGDSVRVRTSARRYSASPALVRTTQEIELHVRQMRIKRIIDTVQRMPLSTIYLFQSRLDGNYLDKFNINEEDKKIFRDAVLERYQDNRAEIDALVAESIERYRRHALAAAAREKMAKRRRRIAWRSEDSFKLATLRIKVIAEEEKEEGK